MVFDSYLKALDSEKLYFLSKDIKEFKTYSVNYIKKPNRTRIFAFMYCMIKSGCLIF